jgi:hypothetical protein
LTNFSLRHRTGMTRGTPGYKVLATPPFLYFTSVFSGLRWLVLGCSY